MNIPAQAMNIVVQMVKNVGSALNIPVHMIAIPGQTMTKPGFTMNIVGQLVNFGIYKVHISSLKEKGKMGSG
jgi:hypothetical protein